MSSTSETRTGLILGFASFGMWGLLPLYWHLLETTAPSEVLAHRMVWSLPTALVILPPPTSDDGRGKVQRRRSRYSSSLRSAAISVGR